MASKQLTKWRIFAASPSDVTNERARLATVVEELRSLAEHVGVTLELVDWRMVFPDLGRPEQIILDQLQPTTWDVFIGILWHRFGTPPGNIDPQSGKEYLSGTEEEFRVAYRLWQLHKRPRVMLYRCQRAIPPQSLDPEQYKRVRDFFQGFSPDADHPGLYQVFDSSDAFERLVRRNLNELLLQYFQQVQGHKNTSANVGIDALSNLTPQDTNVLRLSCEDSMRVGHIYIETADILPKAAEINISDSEVYESIDILDRKGYIEATRTNADIPCFSITLYGFEEYARNCIPDYQAIVNLVISKLVDKNTTHNKLLSKELNKPIRIIDHILRMLQSRNLINIYSALVGYERIDVSDISPELRRML